MNSKLVALIVALAIIGAIVYKKSKKADKFAPYFCSSRTGECADLGSRESTSWGNSVS
jgi:uncharacterized protein YxeA